MRSEIACVRCAVSKIKCVNTGIDTTCRTCADRGLTCTYRPPRWSAGRSKSLVVNGEDEKAEFDWSLLTPAVLNELGAIFTRHFSAELAFLHVPSFLKSIAAFKEADEAATSKSKAATNRNGTSRPKPELILAFLAMTARFHPKLVRYHSTRNGKRKDISHLASEFYAAASIRQMERASVMGRANVQLEDVQVRLLLALHAWTMQRGATAWIMLGEAIRMAQLMGLHHLDEPTKSISVAMAWEIECMGSHPASVLARHDASNSSHSDFGDLQLRRKTFWSCYNMDCQFSLGRNRIRMLQPGNHKTYSHGSSKWDVGEAEDSEFQLDGDFQLVQCPSYRTYTHGDRTDSLIPPSPATGGSGDLTHELKEALDFLHDFVVQRPPQSFHTDPRPPWDPKSIWQKTIRRHLRHKANLPDHLVFSASNLEMHNQSGRGALYTYLHAITITSLAWQHAAWLPFIPMHCRLPQGPLDGPLRGKTASAPPGFWTSTAHQASSGTRQVLALSEWQLKNGELPETPLMGYLVFLAGQSTLYIFHFPWMDPKGNLHANGGAEEPPTPRGEDEQAWPPGGPTNLVVEILTRIAEHSPVARQWIHQLRQLHHYWGRFKSDFRANVGMESVDALQGHLSLRQGGPGGGREEMEHMLRSLRDYGEMVDRFVS